MRAGRLSSRVTIQQRTDTPNDIGELVPTWSTLSAVWADIIHNSGLETLKAGASASVVKASIRIRYRADIKPEMRVVKGSDVYNIEAVLPSQGRVYCDLVCERVQ